MKKHLKGIMITVYLVIWSVSVAAFYLTPDDSGMGYAFIYMWIIMPATTFAVSLVIGKMNYWGKFKWLSPIAFGIMYMLLEYCTFSLANMLAFNKINVPDFSTIPLGIIFSLAGLIPGHILSLEPGTRKKAQIKAEPIEEDKEHK